jgi:hypothetical protein
VEEQLKPAQSIGRVPDPTRNRHAAQNCELVLATCNTLLGLADLDLRGFELLEVRALARAFSSLAASRRVSDDH